MFGVGYGGAVYSGYIHRLMDTSTGDLKTILDKWENKSLGQKILAHLNIFVDWGLKREAAKDLIEARENPNGEIANKIDWKIAAWRRERDKTVARRRQARRKDII